RRTPAARMQRCVASLGRRDRDPHPQALAWIVRQARHVDIAAVAVFDIVGDDLLLRRVIHRLADRLLRGVAAVVRGRDAIAYHAARHGTGDRRRLATVTLAHRAAEHATDDGAENGAAGVVVVLLRHRLRITLLLRRLRDRAVHRIRAQDFRPAVV